jgi:hypothetical protein
MQDRDDLIQRKVPLFADQGEDLLRILLQGGSAAATGDWFANSIFAKALHPAVIAELALTWNCSPASRRDPPASTK